jgi:Protein of unknown function (DUF732)
MRDKTWGERLEDAVDTAANAVGLLSLIAVVVTVVWAFTYCWLNHITARDIGNTIISFVDDGHGDEVGFVQAMHNVGYSEDANAALAAGHKICGRLRSDGSTPTDVANTFEAKRPAGINAAIWRKMTFDLVTNAQVYLCPDTLHNGTVGTTTTTPTRTAPPAPTTMVATTAPPAPTMMVATTAPDSFQYLPLWPFASRQEADRWLRDDAPNGHSPWHAEVETTALYFTQNYLGFTEINQATNVSTNGNEAWVGVGYELPNLEVVTAATIHLARFGTASDAPWEVVGTDDNRLTVTAPAYGSTVGPVIEATGTITGIDESLHLQVRQGAQQKVVGDFCCVPIGGQNSPWSAQVATTGTQPGVLTLVVWTGGHAQNVETFAITGVRTE